MTPLYTDGCLYSVFILVHILASNKIKKYVPIDLTF